MDRLTRHDLKTDKFVEEVGQTVHFFDVHRQQAIRWGGAALGVIVVAAGLYFFMQSRANDRREAFHKVLETYNAPVQVDAPEGMKAFATKDARDKAVETELSQFVAKYSGSNEATASTYLLGAHAADNGKMDEATRYLKTAAADSSEYGSLAKLSLAEVAANDGRPDEAEKLLRELVAKPTVLVSKDQATLHLVRLVAKRNPAEARKMLEPLLQSSSAASREAMQTMGELNLGNK